MNIKNITTKHRVLQRNKETGKGEWVNPIECVEFDNDILYSFKSNNRQIVVSGEHRLWTNNGFIKANEAYKLKSIQINNGLFENQRKIIRTQLKHR
jgi:hypothetical protein